MRSSPSPLLRSPFRFPGGKSWLIPHVRRWLGNTKPQLLVEPFAGGGGVSLAAVSEGLVDKALLVEVDPDIAVVWEAMLGIDAPALAKRVNDFQVSEETVAEVLESTGADTLDRAFRTLLRNRVSHGGILARHGGLARNGEDGKGLRSRWYPDTLARRIYAVASLRDRITFVRGDAFETLDEFAGRADAAWFIDPPYTAGGSRAGARLYTYYKLDHPRLFAMSASLAGSAVLAYDDNPEVRVLAAGVGMDARRVAMSTTHHRRKAELLISRDMTWLRSVREKMPAPRQRDSLAWRDASAQNASMPTVTARESNGAESTFVHANEAAEMLGVSRRTVDRLLQSHELERVARGDGRTHVTRASITACQASMAGPRARSNSRELQALTASVDDLVRAQRRDRAELLDALREREQANVELARLRAELTAERDLRTALERELQGRPRYSSAA